MSDRSTPQREWTASQRSAIEAAPGSILVSAGAGSGKTAVLAERCAYLVADARPASSVDRLLVVTFTDAAAAEMRRRIGETLRARAASRPTDRRLQRQIALLDAAAISTLHAFCKRTLDRYFAQADIDPAATILDENDARLLRHESAKRVFESFSDREDAAGAAFESFVAAYGPSGDELLIEHVLRLAAFLESVEEPDAWLSEAAARFAGCANGRLSPEWTSRLGGCIGEQLSLQRQVVSGHLKEMGSGPGGTQGHIACLEEYDSALKRWLAMLEVECSPEAIDALCRNAIVSYTFPPVPRKDKRVADMPERQRQAFEAAGEVCRAVRDKLFDERLKDGFGRFSTGDWAEGIERTRPHVETLIDLTRAVRKSYREAKRDLGALDFSDLERMTLALLSDETTGIARRLRDKFEHVLVDEFQDVNPVQAAILRMVSREAEGGRSGNLFVVGDVKQSIYRFRLAEPRLFLGRAARFRDSRSDERGAGRIVDLVENFRSRPRVLEAVNAIFERIMGVDLGGIAYDEHARLRPGLAEDAPDVTPIELHLLDKNVSVDEGEADADAPAFEWERIEREAFVIAQRIEQLVANGAAYRDIVVLLRSMTNRGPLLLRALGRLGVPAYADAAGGFFESLEIQDVLSLLSLLDNKQQDIPLAAVLRSPMLGHPLSDTELALLRTNDLYRHAPFHEVVRRYARNGDDPVLRDRLAAIFERLDGWRQRMQRRPLPDVLWEIYEESGYLAYVCGLSEGRRRWMNLVGLHQQAREFASFHRHGLRRFLRFIDDLWDAEVDLNAPTSASAAMDAVRVMTIHRAKGLQFPIVFVGEIGKDFNLRDARSSILFDRRLGIALEAVDVERRARYPTLPHRLVTRAAEDEARAEEMRILYVAMTRAEQRIILVGCTNISRLDGIWLQYREHVGLLPLLRRRQARSAADWIIEAVCCQGDGVRFAEPERSADATPLFEVFTYGAAQMGEWQMERPQGKRSIELLGRIGGLAPIDPAIADDAARGVVAMVARRISTPYAAERLTRVPGIVAASELKRRWHEEEGEAETKWSGATKTSYATRLPGPGVVAAGVEPEPTVRGTLVHAFLEDVDLSRSCDAADLRAQLATWIERTGATKAEAGLIDLDAIAWFFGTDLGKRLREARSVVREWPFVIGVAPTRYDPAAKAQDSGDVLLVRGVVDCLFESAQGWELLDYKTDTVSGEALSARAAEYRGQLAIYEDAVRSVREVTVTHGWLVFLAARQIVMK